MIGLGLIRQHTYRLPTPPGEATGRQDLVSVYSQNPHDTSSGQELAGDNELQSSIWQNNDITLFPGESQTLTVICNSADLQGATPVVSLSGWNAPKTDIAAS